MVLPLLSTFRSSSRLLSPALLALLALAIQSAGLTACASRTNNETDEAFSAPLDDTPGGPSGDDSLARPLSSLPKWKVDKAIHAAASESFVSHASGQAYLSMSVPLEAVSPLVGMIEKEFKVKLKTRGEAHITILTPPEAGALAKAGLGMKEIEGAFASRVQSTPYEALCVGEALSKKDPKLKTYFVVVRSADLVDMRSEILAKAKEEAGGRSVAFEPEKFYPHITIGFTQRDLHIDGDGVIKDARTCKFALDASAP